jgi:hypothetical protein
MFAFSRRRTVNRTIKKICSACLDLDSSLRGPVDAAPFSGFCLHNPKSGPTTGSFLQNCMERLWPMIYFCGDV